MTTGAIDMVLSSGTGSASFGVLRGSDSPGLLLELLFILETSGGQSMHVDRFLPKTPLRIVVDHAGKEVTDQFSAELFDKKLIPGKIDSLLDNETIVETILPNMISAATKITEKRITIEIAKGLKRMNLTLDHEIGRLKALQRKNLNIRPEEIETALHEQKSLASLIHGAQMRMDAIQLIRKE
jgi:ATP-dependent helicase HepA